MSSRAGLLALLFLAGCSGAAPRPSGGTAPVADLYDSYLAERARLDPNWATEVGLHDHDDRLTRFDDASWAARRMLAETYSERLRSIDLDGVSTDERLDASLWKAQLETELHDYARVDDRTVRPDLPLGGVSVIYTMFVKDFAPLEVRARGAVARLKQLAAVIAEVRAKLTNPPRAWTEMAIEDTKGSAGALEDLVGLAGPHAADVRSATGPAKAALEEYARFLEKDLRPRSTGDFAVGRGTYEFYLKRYHLLDLDAARLLDLGKRQWLDTLGMLANCAKGIDPAKTWEEILEVMKRDHPPADQLVAHYRRVVEDARRYMVDRAIVTLPPGEKLEIVETPAFERSSIPYAAYHAPGPLDEARTGHFYVTPVDPKASKEEQEAQLAGHNVYDIPGTVWHEAYPGHHTQFVMVKDIKSKIRALNNSPLLSEGWGFYCEELANETGFFRDPRERLMQLNWRLQRAARIILDVSLHTGAMTFDEAVAFLRDKVRMNEPQAVGSVRGYTRSPSYFMAYMVGMLELVRIRESAQARLGDRFTLREFHDRVLRYGNVPPGLIERELARDWK